ncbi:LexA family transcriptional regulator [Ornithinibacillus sp. JPR2-1]|uniref:LexA family protein n=1 Tax=Ornithinibacillus sp. JPR2-1 TaxID=2094019 RepID=UPI0031E2DCF3
MKKAKIIEQLIKERGSVKEFADRIGMAPTTLHSMLKRGVSKASVDNVIKVCRGLGITVEDLEVMANTTLSDDSNEDLQIKESSGLYVLNNTNHNSEVMLPLFGSIAAGALARVEGITEDELDYIKIPKSFLGKYENSKNLFAMKVNGESMNLLIPNGSYVVAKAIENSELKDDDIVIYSHDGDYSMKRFRRDNEDQVLIFSPESSDKKFRDIVIPFSTQNDLKIHGKVIFYSVALD